MYEIGTRVRYKGNVMAWHGYTGVIVDMPENAENYQRALVPIQFDMIDSDNVRFFEFHNLEILKEPEVEFEVVDVSEKDEFPGRPEFPPGFEWSEREERPVFSGFEPGKMIPVEDPLSIGFITTAKFPWDRHPLSARFHELIEEAGELHDRKQSDYGRDNDPFANVRGAEEWGIPGWQGAMIRAQDKIRRLQKFARTGTLANESVMDSFMDLAVYAIIARILLEEEQGGV